MTPRGQSPRWPSQNCVQPSQSRSEQSQTALRTALQQRNRHTGSISSPLRFSEIVRPEPHNSDKTAAELRKPVAELLRTTDTPVIRAVRTLLGNGRRLRRLSSLVVRAQLWRPEPHNSNKTAAELRKPVAELLRTIAALRRCRALVLRTSVSDLSRRTAADVRGAVSGTGYRVDGPKTGPRRTRDRVPVNESRPASSRRRAPQARRRWPRARPRNRTARSDQPPAPSSTSSTTPHGTGVPCTKAAHEPVRPTSRTGRRTTARPPRGRGREAHTAVAGASSDRIENDTETPTTVTPTPLGRADGTVGPARRARTGHESDAGGRDPVAGTPAAASTGPVRTKCGEVSPTAPPLTRTHRLRPGTTPHLPHCYTNSVRVARGLPQTSPLVKRPKPPSAPPLHQLHESEEERA